MRDLLGVTGLTDLVRIPPHAQPSQVEASIRGALARQADREADPLNVAVNGATVTLKGRVHSRVERDAMQGAAWSSPGVTTVVNDIIVG